MFLSINDLSIEYPEDNKFHFYKYFFDNYKNETNIEYLPIRFDCSNNEKIIQDYLFSLDKNKIYFTIGGMSIHRIPNNVIYFTPGYVGVPIPYLSECEKIEVVKDNLLYYSGSPSHSCRELLNKYNSKRISKNDYLLELSRSKFALCPRGGDYSSYRLYESIICDSIPIYIADYHVLPFREIIDYNKFSFILKLNEIDKIDSILKTDENTIIKIQEELKKHKEYFTPKFTYDYIINYINERF